MALVFGRGASKKRPRALVYRSGYPLYFVSRVISPGLQKRENAVVPKTSKFWCMRPGLCDSCVFRRPSRVESSFAKSNTRTTSPPPRARLLLQQSTLPPKKKLNKKDRCPPRGRPPRRVQQPPPPRRPVREEDPLGRRPGDVPRELRLGGEPSPGGGARGAIAPPRPRLERRGAGPLRLGPDRCHGAFRRES